MEMRMLFTIFLLVAARVASSCPLSDLLSDPIKYGAWQTFKITYNRTYEDEEEEVDRLKIFLENKRIVDEHNEKYERGEVSYNKAINMFSDWTSEEIQSYMKLRIPINYIFKDDPSASTYIVPYNVTVSDEVDWRTKGAVTEVKDQGQCGSCWAFSTTGSLEGQMFRKTGKLVSLSEQNLIDCSGMGCQGGWMGTAFDYIKRNGGIDTEEAYPYEGRENKCRYDPKKSAAKVKGYKRIKARNENELKTATGTNGPIAVAIHVTDSFMQYNGGVFHDSTCSSSRLNHAVLVVGYGTSEEQEEYWLVKNSWGSSWGESGYIKMARNKRNNCGIATYAVFPSV